MLWVFCYFVSPQARTVLQPRRTRQETCSSTNFPWLPSTWHLTFQVREGNLSSPLPVGRGSHKTKCLSDSISKLHLQLANHIFFRFWKKGQIVTTDWDQQGPRVTDVGSPMLSRKEQEYDTKSSSFIKKCTHPNFEKHSGKDFVFRCSSERLMSVLTAGAVLQIFHPP